MRVAVVGAGPLGLFYATHLARLGVDVCVVRRRGEPRVESWHVVARRTGRSFDVELKVLVDLPVALDVVVLAVRAEQLTTQLLERTFAAKARSVVCLTPALGTQLDEWHAAHAELVMGMPAVAAQISEQRLEFWSAPRFWGTPPTLIEQRGANPALLEFVGTLRRAGIPASLAANARSRTIANTVALFPVHVAIYLEPTFRTWPSNPRLLSELAAAMVRAHRLAVRVGHVDVSLRLLVAWLSNARRIELSARSLVRWMPHFAGFLEHHFGPKLRDQHAVLQREIEATAQRLGLASPLPQSWRAALEASGPAHDEQ